MTWFTRWAFGNKAAVIFMVVLIMGSGIFSYFKLPMEFLPSADFPQISVTVVGQGYDAKSMLDNATAPIEKAVSSVTGRKETFSTSADGFMKIDMTFDSDIKMKDAAAGVQEAISSIVLPAGMSKPFVIRLNTSMIPLSMLSLSFKDGITKANMELTEQKIVPDFENINGLASVVLGGKTVSKVFIHPDADKLANAKIPVQALMGVLQGQNLAVSVGEKSIDGKTSGLKVIGNLNDIETLNNLTVAPGVKLKDVATVELSSNNDTLTRVNGKDVLMLVVTKDASSNAVAISDEVAELAAKVETKYPNATAEVVNSTAEIVVTSVNSMMREVLLGALFATIVILLFLRNLRSTLITIVSIPLSLGLTLFLLSKSGVTLNILTLGGVAVAVGRLVDDSIVVIENIFRRTQKAEFSKELIIDATREVARAITASTLTTVAVFLPLGLLQGSLQAFLLPFALTVTYSLLSSLFVALTVVPLMSAWLLRNAKLGEHKSPKRLVNVLTWSLNHKIISIGLSFVLFLGSLIIYFNLPKGAVSDSTASQMEISLSYPPETPITTIRDKAIELEKFIIAQPEVKNSILQQGNSEENAKWGSVTAPTTASFQIMMKKDAKTQEFIDRVNAQKGNYPNAVLDTGANSFSGGSSSAITMDLTGDSAKDLTEAAAQVTAAIKSIAGIAKVTSNQDVTKPGYSITVDPAQANPQEIAMSVRSLLNQTPIGSMKIDGTETPVVLDALINPTTSADLSNIQIMTANGPAALTSVAKIEETNETNSILHKDGKQFLRVSALVDPTKLSEIDKDIKAKTKDLKLPAGVELIQGGAAAQQSSEFMDLFMTIIISIGIVLLIMVVTFKTFRAPIASIFSLPFAAVGAIVAMMITGTSFDVTSIFGFLMLIGIVVTNAIVLIDRVRQNEEKMPIRESLLEAAATRTRPIIMTAVATICAMLPLVISKAEEGSIVSKGLAIVVIGGLSVATVFTLIMVPTIYELLHFVKARRQRKNATVAPAASKTLEA
ncbi:efflux RND transporter permease subunit [Paenibacillus psychroresistens]|uniref:Efflux RND transporter permease subunit n=1 Tax=Paenibacillus psychroresistens TaxID=1778678 RepID=A0A6B8RF76_9BACL|nr:efflux RND transporter permease subunit [Paenibacillus psychroresistens]QGQ94840.1 efflux RND transporter permease subunit [Paenibacillus psychroresistens]